MSGTASAETKFNHPIADLRQQHIIIELIAGPSSKPLQEQHLEAFAGIPEENRACLEDFYTRKPR